MSDSTCNAGWCANDDYCAITCTADPFGRKWHPVIVHRLLEAGPLGFNALQDAVSDIASNALSDNLDRLQTQSSTETSSATSHSGSNTPSPTAAATSTRSSTR